MSNYEVPKWAGKGPSGLHLDVLKDDKFIQKILIDEKKCYFFGRSELNDFRIDHASCSRYHACLLYHKNLNLNYLVDLNSTHGTFISTSGGAGSRSLRLEPQKPTVLQIGSTFHFGASTRNYILRERVKALSITEDIPGGSEAVLPENEDEVDQITEYNTAHNRKISTLGITDSIVKKGVKRKQVHFNDDEIIINPEDVDSSIGRFRNLVQSTVIPMSNKKARLDSSGNFGIGSSSSSSSYEHKHTLHHPIMSAPSTSSLYSGLDEPERHDEKSNNYSQFLFPNPAPDLIEPSINKVSNSSSLSTTIQLPYSGEDYSGDYEHEPKKKKYKKETWHGAKKTVVKAFGDI